VSWMPVGTLLFASFLVTINGSQWVQFYLA